MPKTIQFKNIKGKPIFNDLMKLDKEDLAVNFLTCYNSLQEINKSKENYSSEISNNTFTCFFCLEKLNINDLSAILDNGNILLCGLCLKNGWARADEIKPKEQEQIKPNKEQLENELKHYKEIGLENYLNGFKDLYLNHIKDLENKLKEL